MEYSSPDKTDPVPRIQPRLIIHGGAGNLTKATLTPEKQKAYRAALNEIITRTNVYMNTPATAKGEGPARLPSALETATFAVALLEDYPLFNSGRGAVFTRDGINELEASVMVSRGKAKRGVGVTGLRRVRNPILLARRLLEHGDEDLAPGSTSSADSTGSGGINIDAGAQGHTLVHGATAEALASSYGLPLVHPSYFFMQDRWDEHVRALEREKRQRSGSPLSSSTSSCTWSPDEYLPQGTCGAVALDADGIVCCATSTGGLTNKLTGRIGDTPVIGAGAWADTWTEDGDPTAELVGRQAAASALRPVIELSRALCSVLADCLPVPRHVSYTLLPAEPSTTSTTRSLAVSGTGNGDSFLRVSAAHTVAAMAQYRPMSTAAAVSAVSGPGGVLQQSAGDRWGRTGEGEGGMIGIESVLVRDSHDGIVRQRSTVVQDCNSGGMFRAWVDDAGEVQVRIFRDDTE